MKTITKTFYVDKHSIENLKKISGWNIYIQIEKNDIRNHPIQISWQEPERKIEISESEFRNRLHERGYYSIEGIIEEFFGASDEL